MMSAVPATAHTPSAAQLLQPAIAADSRLQQQQQQCSQAVLYCVSYSDSPQKLGAHR